jgi:hypothetical protein
VGEPEAGRSGGYFSVTFSDNPLGMLGVQEFDLSGTALSLTVSNSTLSSLVPLEVTNTGEADFSTSGSTYEYYHSPQVIFLAPSSGPSRGGTAVRVALTGSLPESIAEWDSGLAVCSFGGTLVRVSKFDLNLLSSAEASASTNVTTLSCISPAHPNMEGGPVPVLVSYNGGVDFLDGEFGVTFLYTPHTAGLVSLSPISGPSSGGTLVTAYGRDIAPSMVFGVAHCAFGDSVIPADEVGEGFLRCTSPARDLHFPVTHQYAFEYSLNSGYEYTVGAAQWVYEEDAHVGRLTPAIGPTTGGTLVRVEGGPFPADRDILCRFGDTEVPGQYLGPSSLSCRSPPATGINEIQSISISNMAFSPAIVNITASADPPRPEVHVLALESSAEFDEVQLVSISWADIDEIQEVFVGQDFLEPHVLQVQSSVTPELPTVVHIAVSAENSPPIALLSLECLHSRQNAISEMQVIKVNGTGGTFDLELAGEVATGIPYNADATVLWSVLTTGLSVIPETESLVVESTGLSQWHVTFPAAMGDVDPLVGYATPGAAGVGIESVEVSTTRRGSVQEIQSVSVVRNPSLPGAEFTLSMYGFSTVPIPSDASAEELRSYLEVVPHVGGIAVSQSNETQWLITFLDLAGNVPELVGNSGSSDLAIHVDEVQEGTSHALQGDFGVSWGGQTSRVISSTASAETVKSTIESFAGVTDVSVVKSEGPSGGASWAITFNEFDGQLPLSEKYLELEASTLTGSDISATYVMEHGGSTLGGNFWIVADEGEDVVKTSSLLKFDAPDSAMHTALEELGIYGSEVTSSKFSFIPAHGDTPWQHRGKIWEVTFPASLEIVPGDLSLDVSALVGSGATGQVFVLQEPVMVEIQVVKTFSTYPEIGGFFRLYFPPTDMYTELLPYNVTAATMEAALRDLEGLSPEITVSREGPRGPLRFDSESLEHSWPDLMADLHPSPLATFTWHITFHGHAGPLPLLVPEHSPSNDAILGVDVVVQRGRTGGAEPLSGSWSIIFDGIQSQAISWNASAADVCEALSGITPISATADQPDWNGQRAWMLTFSDWNNESSPHALSVNSQDLRGTSATLITESLSGDFVAKEVQRINATSSSLTCSFAGSNASPFADTATAGEVAKALGYVDSSILGPIRVEEVGSSAWDVTFVGNGGPNVPLMECGSTAIVDRLARSASQPLGGTFSLAWMGDVTEPIPWNASALTVETALGLVVGVEAVEVSILNSWFPEGGRFATSWEITFTSSAVDGNVPSLGIVSNLTGTNPVTSVAELQAGGEPGGRFSLEIESGPEGFQDPYSGWINVGDSPQAVSEAIRLIDGVQSAEVRVSASLPYSNLAYEWEVIFARRKDGVMAGQQGDMPQLRPRVSQLTGPNVSVNTTTLQDGQEPIGGTFNLSTTGMSRSFSWDAAASDISQWLLDSAAFPGGTNVSRSGPGYDGSYNWTISIPPTVGQPQELFVNDSLLSGISPRASVDLIQTSTFQLGGTFRLIINDGIQTDDVHVNTSAADLEAMLSAVLLGEVHVSKQDGGVASVASWLVTFASLEFSNEVPEIDVNDSALLGGSCGVEISVESYPFSGDIALLVVDGFSGGYFTLHDEALNISTGALAMNASAGDVANALQDDLNYVNAVYVEKFALPNRWKVLFVDPLTGYATNISVNADELRGAGNATWSVLETSIDGGQSMELRGDISLAFGERCTTPASGIHCTTAWTDPIAWDSAPEDFAAALLELPEILDVQVLLRGDSWAVPVNSPSRGFGVALRHRVLDISFLSVERGGAATAAAAEWHRTWSPAFSQAEPSIGRGQVIPGGDLPALLVDFSQLVGLAPVADVQEVLKGRLADAGGAVAVEVSLNGQDWTSSAVIFDYRAVSMVSQVLPQGGPLSGGTEILVLGSGFERSSFLSCRFWPPSIPLSAAITTPVSSWLNSSAIVCVTPPSPMLDAGTVRLDIGFQGGFQSSHTADQDNGVMFVYHADIAIENVSPSLGPASGNFSVRVSGGPFPLDCAEHVRCKFGGIIVRGERMSANDLLCMAPPHEQGYHTLEVYSFTYGIA